MDDCGGRKRWNDFDVLPPRWRRCTRSIVREGQQDTKNILLTVAGATLLQRMQSVLLSQT